MIYPMSNRRVSTRVVFVLVVKRRRHTAQGFNPGKTVQIDPKSPCGAKGDSYYQSISRKGNDFNDPDSPAPLTGLRNSGGGVDLTWG